MVKRGVLFKMKQVIDVFKREEAENRLKVLKFEIDYELLTLHDAIIEGNEKQIKQSKEKLEKYRKELLELEV